MGCQLVYGLQAAARHRQRSAGETGLRARYGVTVVAVKSQARGEAATFTYATSDTVLMYGDVILVVGTIRDVERFAEVD
jgi:trk system potassium uptake protein TrkA